VSISISQELLDRIDARARDLGLPRSQYLAMLARKDVMLGGSLVIPTATAPIRVNLTDEAVEFLKIAVPALIEYERHRDEAPIPEPPQPLADSELWEYFLKERAEIVEYKWLESEKLGHDIGIERAIREWLQKHHALWAAAQDLPADE
jgi:hypothetical protein